ncbi:MAG: hypothetical protein AAGC60_05280 [Acidobacteriota bacterium]
MKFTRLVLFLLAACLVAAPLLLGAADRADASELPTFFATGPATCGLAPARELPVFEPLPFVEAPIGCFSCQLHLDCRTFCGGEGACFPDLTYTCSLSRYDKFCIC